MAEKIESALVVQPDDFARSSSAEQVLKIEMAMGQMLNRMAQPAALAARLESRFIEWRDRRRIFESEWLECYERWIGSYSGLQLSRMDPRKSHLWVGLTAMKVNAAHSAITDALRGSGEDRSFALEPPNLPDSTIIPEGLEEMGVTLGMIRKNFAQRAEDFEGEIENQFKAGDFDEEQDATILEMCITGSGAMIGPVTVAERGTAWEMNLSEMDVLREVQKNGFRPQFKNISIFNVYPDLQATNIENGSGVFEEMQLTRGQMLDLALTEGISLPAVLAALRHGPNMDVSVNQLHTTLRAVIGDSRSADPERYSVKRYFGEVTGADLEIATGDRVPDEVRNAAVRGEVWFCGQYILKAKPLHGPIPLHIVPYIRRGPVPFGKGVPMLGKSSQDALNGSARAIMDNMGIASGPIIEKNVSVLKLQPGEDPADIYGWQVILTDHRAESGVRAVTITALPAYTQEFMQVFNTFRQIIDEETFQPSLTQGVQGIGTTKTAMGMSLLNTNANKSTKKVMRNVDARLIEPVVEAMVQWNIRYNPNPIFQLPVKVFAKGSISLMAQEVRTQRMLTLLQIIAGNPAYTEDELVSELARGMGIHPSKIVPSDEERALMQQAAAEQETMQNGAKNSGGVSPLAKQPALPPAPGTSPNQPLAAGLPPAGG